MYRLLCWQIRLKPSQRSTVGTLPTLPCTCHSSFSCHLLASRACTGAWLACLLLYSTWAESWWGISNKTPASLPVQELTSCPCVCALSSPAPYTQTCGPQAHDCHFPLIMCHNSVYCECHTIPTDCFHHWPPMAENFPDEI